MSDLMNVSSNPHIRSKLTTNKIMLCVVLALMPAAGYGIYNFGLRALIVMLISICSCVLTELLFELITKQRVTIGDLSAVVTGLLLGMNLPVNIPFWVPVLGGIFAIFVVKMLFGGLGKNFMNPALGARCFLLISFPALMTDFTCDAYTGATPLAAMRAGESVTALDLMFGRCSGTIGETSMIAIMIGAIFLIMMGIINLRIPGMYLLSFALFIGIFGDYGFNSYYICSQLAAGGIMLGAWFMATDYVTRPVTRAGQYIFGITLGVLTGIFRIYGGSAEGVSYAIIIGNLLVPLMEKITYPKSFGRGGERR